MTVNDVKEIVIKEDVRWLECRPSEYYVDELRVGENFIHNIRKIYTNSGDSIFEWRFETKLDLYNYKKDFLKVCEHVLKIKETNFYKTCSYCYYIEVIFKDGSVKEYTFYEDLTTSGMEELKDAILNALPANCDVYPSCIK